MAGTLLTHQARVLLAVAGDCNVRMRDLADQVGLTERAVYDAISDLVAAGYLERQRVGRRNCYRLLLEPRNGEAAEVEAVGGLAWTAMTPRVLFIGACGTLQGLPRQTASTTFTAVDIQCLGP